MKVHVGRVKGEHAPAYSLDPEPEIPGNRPVSLTLSPALPAKKILRTSSAEADSFKGLPLKPRKGLSTAEADGHFFVLAEEAEPGANAEKALFLLSCSVGAVEERPELLVGGGEGNGGGGGGACGGGGGGGGWEWGGQGSESLDEHYQSLIKSYPGDALLLGNYARFLKDVRGDAEKAEEYCARAILAKQSNEPADGNVLSLYGDLIWKKHKDAPRARGFFDQALQSSPDDCYVLASYARFLWDSREDDDDEEEDDEKKLHIDKQGTNKNHTRKFLSTTDNQNVAAAYWTFSFHFSNSRSRLYRDPYVIYAPILYEDDRMSSNLTLYA
ncbi:hypothetical protein CDL15_Pgr015751 [Punica granatum]|uniref:Uncharacterized protein n=1 Tax=Punica granatum TaxID=22663 RepID=A0A218XN79_PUNGR|nr:hypothetical protein CDL15_Pgr015751 [Punica granatum]